MTDWGDDLPDRQQCGGGTAATTDYYYAGQQMMESDQGRRPALSNGANSHEHAVRLVAAGRQRADRERPDDLDLQLGRRREVGAVPARGSTI